jgi:hypothetical protein
MYIKPLHSDKNLRIVPEPCYGMRPAWTLQSCTRILGIPCCWRYIQTSYSIDELLVLADHLTLRNPITLIIGPAREHA